MVRERFGISSSLIIHEAAPLSLHRPRLGLGGSPRSKHVTRMALAKSGAERKPAASAARITCAGGGVFAGMSGSDLIFAGISRGSPFATRFGAVIASRSGLCRAIEVERNGHLACRCWLVGPRKVGDQRDPLSVSRRTAAREPGQGVSPGVAAFGNSLRTRAGIWASVARSMARSRSSSLRRRVLFVSPLQQVHRRDQVDPFAGGARIADVVERGRRCEAQGTRMPASREHRYRER